jgi:hypothetical protein
MKKALKKARQDCRYGANTYDFGVYTTNDLPGCPKGGLLKGTDKPDKLEGGLGSDILCREATATTHWTSGPQKERMSFMVGMATTG